VSMQTTICEPPMALAGRIAATATDATTIASAIALQRGTRTVNCTDLSWSRGV
jgi:hypothetical protein